jgi:hypothetical protein
VRRQDGRETYHRLREWDKGSTAAERLAVQLLYAFGFRSIDPSHPLGGPDGLKDAICTRGGIRWAAAAYFPRGQQSFGGIKKKFLADLKGAEVNNAKGFVFVTNQELSLDEREELKAYAGAFEVEILHLEKIGSMLNTPPNYGVRLEFLDLDMSREEQLAFIAARDSELYSLRATIEALRDDIQKLIARSEAMGVSGKISVPLGELQEFKSILDKITESDLGRIYSGSWASTVFGPHSGNINNLHVPLAELTEFAEILDRITGRPGYAALAALVTRDGKVPGHVDRLQVPLSALHAYEEVLDRIIEKRRKASGGFDSVPDLPKLPSP